MISGLFDVFTHPLIINAGIAILISAVIKKGLKNR